MIDLKEIGKRLQLIRKQLDYLQKDFAEALEISNASLSEIEAGNAKPRFQMIYNLTRKFDVNILFLLHGKGDMFLHEENSRKFSIEVEPEDREFLSEFFFYFTRSELVRINVKRHFIEYLLSHEELIAKDIKRIEAKLNPAEKAPPTD